MPHRTAKALTARLAALAGVRQIQLLDRADGIANDVDKLFARTWRKVLRTLRSGNAFDATQEIWQNFQELWPELAQLLVGKFTRLAQWSHASSAKSLTQSLPVDYLQAATPVPADVAAVAKRAGMLEDFNRDLPPGLIDFRTDLSGQITYTDRPAPLREPSTQPLSDEASRKLFESLLFPPLPEDQIKAMIFRPGWAQKIESLSKLAAPDVLANTVMRGMAQGQTQAEIAQALLPALNGVRASARRVARTAGMDVAHQSQMAAFDAIGDLIAGYQIHAQLDQHTRPAHAARNGTVYWKKPEKGQLGLEAMPQPPKEADGSYAPNCRCHLTPVLHPPSKLRDQTPVSYATATGKIVPDPAVYSEWFERAPDRLRRMAVGVRRYEYVKQQSGGKPVWSDFLDPESGELLHLDTIKKESPADRAKRRQAVDQGIAHRRHLIVAALDRGFIAPNQDRFATFANVTTSI